MNALSPTQAQVRAQIYGRVQGVFFRAWTQETAQRLGLKGWVRNCTNGSVELLAQGTKETLKEFLLLCRQGPPAADVSQIKSEWSAPETALEDFLIQRGE